MRELLYQETSVHHLDFSPMKDIAYEMISL